MLGHSPSETHAEPWKQQTVANFSWNFVRLCRRVHRSTHQRTGQLQDAWYLTACTSNASYICPARTGHTWRKDSGSEISTLPSDCRLERSDVVFQRQHPTTLNLEALLDNNNQHVFCGAFLSAAEGAHNISIDGCVDAFSASTTESIHAAGLLHNAAGRQSGQALD